MFKVAAHHESSSSFLGDLAMPSGSLQHTNKLFAFTTPTFLADVCKEAEKTVQQKQVLVECREFVGCLGLVWFFLVLAVHLE